MIPSVLQIGPWPVTVIVDEAAIHKAGQESRSDLMGHWSPRNLQIILRPDMPPTQEIETLLHEILHGCFSVSGLETTYPSDDEERFIAAIAPTLLDTLRRNPGLTNYLTS